MAGILSPFAPRGITTLIRYADLEEGFNLEYDCLLDLGHRVESQRFLPQSTNSRGNGAKKLARVLNDALLTVQEVIEQGNQPELIRYFQAKLNAMDNRTCPLYIRVNSRLPVNSARYYSKAFHKVEIIFSQQFALELLGAYNTHSEVVALLFGERLFHEICHTNNEDITLAFVHEARRIERDRQLHKLIVESGRQCKIDEYCKGLHPTFHSGYYFKFLEELTKLEDRDRERAIYSYLMREYPINSASNLAVIVGRINLKQYTTPAKFAIYSGPPGGGKGVVWERFSTLFGPYIERLVLFHTRRMRVGEIQDETYHFRTKEHLEKLEAEGKIITAEVNHQLQGLAKSTFEDAYLDPEIHHEKTVTVKGLDSVFGGDKISVLECGLAWFQTFKCLYPDILTIFISPYDTPYLEEQSHNPKAAFDAVIGKEVALRIHDRECKEADIEAQKFKEDPDHAKFYLPTPQTEYLTRINEAVEQVRRRNDYHTVLVNEWGHEELIDELAEKFAKGIFSNLLNAMGIPFDEKASGDRLVMLLASTDLKSKATRAKLNIYSATPGGGKVLLWERFMEKYGARENLYGEKLITKFRLFHTRPRRPMESQNGHYYFRSEGHLNRLRHEGKILTTLVNNQLQGLALKTFEDVYVDPETQQESRCQVIGFDSVFNGSQIVILEGGLAWFEQLNAMFDEEMWSIFISPFSDEFIESCIHNPRTAFAAIVGKEIALRIHAREWQEAQIRKETAEAGRKEGKIEGIKFFFPTPQKEFVSRIEEAVEQVRRRTEYRTVLVNKWAHSEEEFRSIVSHLTEEFSVGIFSNLYNSLGEGYVKA